MTLVAACGSTSSSTGTPRTSWPPGPIAGARVLAVLSLPGAGGRVGPTASPLDTGAQIARFTAQFRLPAMRVRVRAAVRGGAGRPVVGQVVAVGCDHPRGVDVTADGSGRVVLSPRAVASRLPECRTAVTTVAVAALPHR